MKIEETFKNLFIEKANEHGCNLKGLKALLFKREETGDIEINLYVNNQFAQKIDIKKDILKIKLDFMNKEFMIKQFLFIFLGAYKEELQCEEKEVSVQLETRSDEDASVIMALKKGKDFVRWISYEEFNL